MKAPFPWFGLEILVVMKDFCKEHVQGEIEQTTLFDLPKPTQYQ